jgi:hypothetical protein
LAIAPIDIEFSETFQDPYVPLALLGSNPKCRDTNIDEIIQNAALDAISNADLEAESELSITSTSSPLTSRRKPKYYYVRRPRLTSGTTLDLCDEGDEDM